MSSPLPSLGAAGSTSEHDGSSTSRRDLILRFGVEVGGIVALVQLGRGLPVDTIDHPSALYRWSLKELVGPALDVSVVLHTQELCCSIEPAFR